MKYDEHSFEEMCWHDCRIWSIAFCSGGQENDDWRSDLALDIDFICEWDCGKNGCQFRVAPALLVFHGVVEPRIAIDWGKSSLLHELSIGEIYREPVTDSSIGIHQGLPNYRWSIKLNWPEHGELAFIGSGFTQTLSAEPTLSDEQNLSLNARNAMLRRGR